MNLSMVCVISRSWAFFSLWPEIRTDIFPRHANLSICGIMMVAWQWTPFAVLIFMTSLQSEDEIQKEAAILTVHAHGRSFAT